MLKTNQGVKVKKEFQRDKFDNCLGFVSELNALDGSYTKVRYIDGDDLIKTEWLELG